LRLSWTNRARLDRKDIREHIAQENLAAAVALDELFAGNTAALADHPELGRAGRVAGTRELVVHRNYMLIYDIAGDSVRVLRVLHAARKWPPKGAESDAPSRPTS
jgi:addiction module RelE/StbE family toxin